MFGQVIPRSFLCLVTLCAVLTIGIIGCGGDDDDGDDANANDWVGTWKIETADGENYEQLFEENLEAEFGEGVNVSIVANEWRFNNDGTLERELAFKVTGKIGDEDISGTLTLKGTGTYSLSGSNYTVTYTLQEDGTGWFEGEEETFTEEASGTWSREGNTLTINSDDGTTIVFKRK